MYLINKDETEHTGQESYVWKMYQERCWESCLRGTAFGNSTRTSSTDGFSEQPSLPFPTATRLFLLLCSYL
ncbi:unnamed protein product [Tetraodon nigroviridis]|uniref:Chromosome undetermined SCAF9933, whole genome shotgun sequence n=1 Tax=Tetraodon nigroviridis TaxID=99883 RepID=Q4T3S2_TETNG|nr:unnamed protein product [Tetraodon nigroviridis]